MATKWEATYTDLTNVNSGNEYEDGDAITTDSVNVPIKNSAYAIQVANQAKIYAENAMNQTQHIPVVEYNNIEGTFTYQVNKSGLYGLEVSFGYDEQDNLKTMMITLFFDINHLGDVVVYPKFYLPNSTTTSVNITVNQNYITSDRRIIKIIRL